MKILKLLSLNFLFITFISANNYNFNNIKESLSDIVLVINFNHPYYSNIPFLKSLYEPFFKKILFYGENEGNEVIKVETRTGYLLNSMIKDACSKFEDAAGYLFLQDDCVLHVWNLINLNKEKIWYAVKWQDGLDSNDRFYSIMNINGRMSSGYSWFKWDYDCGLNAVRNAYFEINNIELEKLNRNLGYNNIAGAMCEVFYIPQKFKEQFIDLSEIFKNVFCEIAIPTMLCCIEDISNWEQLVMLGGAGVGTGNPDSPMLKNYPKEVTWVHPVKFSFKENREKIAGIFEIMIEI